MNLINNGVLKEGDKIPSLRHLSRELNVSVNTVKEAYWRLENQNYICAVPQSGYYVKKQPQHMLNKSDLDPSHLDPSQVSLCHIYGAFQNTGRCAPEIGLGIAGLNPEYRPMDKMNRFFQMALRHQEFESYNYMMPPGYLMLRQQIARLGITSGLDLSPDDIITTNRCHEAIFLALMVLCKPGDTVVLECPVYFGLLQLLQHQVHQMRSCLLTHLPKGTRVTRPEGGSLLWVELPRQIDTFDIYQHALKEQILIAPGRLFSMKNKYANCFRINSGVWNARVEKAIGRVGELCAKEMLRASSRHRESQADVDAEPVRFPLGKNAPETEAEEFAEGSA